MPIACGALLLSLTSVKAHSTLFVIRHSLYMFDHIVVYRGNFITCAPAILYEAGILLVTSVDLRVSQDVCVSLSA